MTKSERRQAGRTLTTVLALLVLLVGGGAWNYHRNLQSEQQDDRPRPFANYETTDLEALRAAYAQEIESSQQRYTAHSARRQRASGEGLMDERVREFERIQRTSDRLRELRADVAEQEARLREIDAELARRAGAASGMRLHLERLLTI
jgi:hypothetical protein